MINTFEVITKYIPSAVDKYFAHESKSVILERGKKWIDVNFNQTGYVKIADMLLDGLSDYYQTQQDSLGYVNPSNARPLDTEEANYSAYAGNVSDGSRDGLRIGGVDVRWEIHRLQWVRGKQFRIDYIANEETAGVVIGNAMEEFHRLKVIPEVDVARFSYIADQTAVSLGNLVTEDITANTIMAHFNEVFAQLFEMGVPAEEQVIFVNPTVMALIRNTTELTKFITQENYRSDAGLDFTVSKYMGRPIIEVSTDRFFTHVLLTDGGYRAQSTSKVINFMVVSTKATVPVRKIEYTKVYGPELAGIAGFHGFIINYLLYHGIFVPRNKVPGVYVSVSNTDANTKVNLLKVHTRKTTGNNWELVNYFTNPAGLRGTLVYSETEFDALGSTVTIDGEDVKAITYNTLVTEGTANKQYYFGLVDGNGKLIAKSGLVTVNA